MELQILAVLCLASFCNYADALITNWAVTGNDAVANAMATAQTGTSLAENVATSSTTSISAVATTGATSISGYAIGAQTPASPANLLTVSAAGLISVGATALDYEAYTEIIVEVVATDDTSATGTATVTFAVTGINDNTPAFTAASFVANIRSGSCSGTAVGTYGATDGDRAGTVDSTLTYSVHSGANGKFTIDSSTGALTVTVGQTVRYEDQETYTMVLRATDAGVTPGALTGSTTVTLYVCGATSISLSLATLLVALLASLR